MKVFISYFWVIVAVILQSNCYADIVYDATAGIGGTIEVSQADGYTSASEDTAELTADIPIEYEVFKTVALAVHDGSSFTGNDIFSGITVNPSVLSLDDNSLTVNNQFIINGALFTNTENLTVSFGDDAIVLVHESDPASTLDVSLSSPTTGVTFNTPFTVNANSLNSTNGVFQFSIEGDIDEIDSLYTNKPGNYSGSITITTSIL